MLGSLLVGSAGEVRIKHVPGYLLEQQIFVFCYSSSCCLVMWLREAVSSIQETGSKEGCLILLVPFEKLHSLISSRKELWSPSPPTCHLQYSQLCIAYNHSTGAVIFHPALQGAFSSPEKQGNCSQSFSTFSKMQRHGYAGSLGLGGFQPICWNKGRLRIFFFFKPAGWKKWHPQLVIPGGWCRGRKLKNRDKHMCH